MLKPAPRLELIRAYVPGFKLGVVGVFLDVVFRGLITLAFMSDDC